MAWSTRVRLRIAVVLASVVALLATFAQAAPAQFITVSNPVISQRADTAIYKHTDGYYYMTASVPDYKRVELRRATTLQGLRSAATSNAFVAPSSDVVPKERALIPQYSEMLPHLARAFDEASRLGVTLVGFESMCGLPLCLVPAELNRYYDFSDIPEGFDGGEFVKGAPCERCSLSAKCYGLRRGYRDLYGDSELVPVKAAG